MEEYSAKEIGRMLTGSQALSSLEAYAFGFMTGFVVKQNVNELLQRIIALRPDSSQIISMESFNRFAKLLYDLRHIQESEIDTLATYFQEIEIRIKDDFTLLSRVQLFYFGRFHSLYNEADIHKQMKKANEQNETRRKNNDYPSEKEILKEIKKNLNEEVSDQPHSHRNLQKLNKVKIEAKKEETGTLVDENQSGSILSNEKFPKETQMNMEVESTPVFLHRPPPPQVLGRVAKKSSKNPPKKPESPIQQQDVSNEPTNLQGHNMLPPTNSFSLGLLAETFKLNTQMQSQYNTNTNQFGQFFTPPNLIKNQNSGGITKTAQPTIIDLEEEEEEEIIFDQKTTQNEDIVVQKGQDKIDQSDPVVSSSSLTKPMLIEDELIVVNKTPQTLQTPQKAQIDSIDRLESKNIAKVALNALLSDKKRSSTDKSSEKSEKKSHKLKTKKEKPQPQQIRFEQEEEEEKTSQLILNPVNSDDIYDISYYSSDDMSYMSSPRSSHGPKELVLSYKSENELEEDTELSFNGNINVFCQS